MPDPLGSLPAQLTRTEVEAVIAGRGFTALVGAVLSIMLVTVLVAIAALTSKTMLAWLVMAAPLPRLVLGLTVKVTKPVP
jgi:hypothetical protein